MPTNPDGSIDWDQINNAVGDGIAESGNTVNGEPLSSSSSSSSSSSDDLSSDGNPTQDALKEYHDTWGDTTTSFEDAAGPSYEEQIASEAISSGGASLDSLEQDISSLPNTTLEGVREEFQNMIGGSSEQPTNEPATNEPATNEPATPSIPSLPSLPSLSADSIQSMVGGAAGLVIAVIMLAVVFLTGEN